MVSIRSLILLVIITIAGVIASFITGLPLFLGFLPGLSFLIYLANKQGLTGQKLWRAMWEGFLSTKEVMLILIMVGILIPVWTANGTIPYMIQLGLALVDPAHFTIWAFGLTALMSMLLGTALGTLSTLGIPLIGAASLLGIPAPAVAGAVVSGALLGDRTSPISSANLLNAVSVNVEFREHRRGLLPTTVAAIAVAALFFFLFDYHGYGRVAGHIASGYHFASWFALSPILLLPPLCLLVIVASRLNTHIAFGAGILLALLTGGFYQNIAAAQWLHWIWSGYDATNIAILHGKGLEDVVSLIIFIGLSGAFNGILNETGMILPFVRRWMGGAQSMMAASLRAGLFGLGLGMMTCNQALPVMMSGNSLAPVWSEKYPKKELSRVIADTSLMFPALIPWSMLAILASRIINVEVTVYVPYAVFVWSLPFITLAYSGWLDRRQRKTDQ